MIIIYFKIKFEPFGDATTPTLILEINELLRSQQKEEYRLTQIMLT